MGVFKVVIFILLFCMMFLHSLGIAFFGERWPSASDGSGRGVSYAQQRITALAKSRETAEGWPTVGSREQRGTCRKAAGMRPKYVD